MLSPGPCSSGTLGLTASNQTPHKPQLPKGLSRCCRARGSCGISVPCRQIVTTVIGTKKCGLLISKSFSCPVPSPNFRLCVSSGSTCLILFVGGGKLSFMAKACSRHNVLARKWKQITAFPRCSKTSRMWIHIFRVAAKKMELTASLINVHYTYRQIA